MKTLIYSLIFLFSIQINFAQKIDLQRVEPPNWWVGMQNSNLQLMVYGKDIAKTDVVIKSEKVRLVASAKVENPNYLFLDLKILETAKAGTFDISFQISGKEKAKYTYTLADKTPRKRGFSQADLIYLLMPDRFANGNPDNDSEKGMLQGLDRENRNGRHGGDLEGIIQHLDYIKDLGMTALWINPAPENDNKMYSYHGYGMTDFYKIDSRLGTMTDYLNLSDAVHKADMKMIIDMVFNHIGSDHWWVNDMPMPDWFNHNKDFRTTYRAATVADPYASAADMEQLTAGWFVETMPDLNQHNPYVANYLIQNSIWWVETAQIDGIRMDTQAYPFKDFMAEWALTMKREYPDLTLLGELWLPYIAYTAYFQGDSRVSGDYNSHLDCITDFPLHYAFKDAFNEDDGWQTGLLRFYYTLGRDFLYPNAGLNVTFLDNHDIDRHFSSVKKDVRSQKMGIAMLLTTRGTPSIYYGTETLSTGFLHEGHGFLREDMPGGWPSDSVNVFTRKNLSDEQTETLDYLKKIANWRKTNKPVGEGKLMHFVPDNNVYVYFRYTENEAVMVLVNNHNSENRDVETSRYNEILKKYSSGKDIVNGKKISDLSKITVPSKSVLIIELTK